jgi:hypothetical protein
MSEWGTGHFENDDAADFILDLQDADDTGLLPAALRVAVESAAIDVVASHRAVAAAEVVAALRGQPSSDLPEEVEDYVQKVGSVLPTELVQLALKAVARVRADVQRDLTLEEWEVEDLIDELADLERRLK